MANINNISNILLEGFFYGIYIVKLNKICIQLYISTQIIFQDNLS